MKKNLLLASLFFLATSIHANTPLSKLTDANLCSWFQVANTPQEYINEAKRRNLSCEPRVKFKIECGLNKTWSKKGCEEIPVNSRKFNSEWICDLGFKKVNKKCEVVNLPENGFFTSNLDGYACKVGYIKKSNNCEKKQPKLPINAYKRGDSFACVSGYYKDKNSCVLLPANGVAYFSSEGFYCTNKYRKSSTQNKCVLKPLPIVENKTSDIWQCGDGFYRVKNDCIQIPTIKDKPKFLQVFFNDSELIIFLWCKELTGWLFNDRKPTTYLWLALIILAIALDKVFSLSRKRKEKKAKKAEIY